MRNNIFVLVYSDGVILRFCDWYSFVGKGKVVRDEVKLECSNWKAQYWECFCIAIQELN
jgi:hypothetical protein